MQEDAEGRRQEVHEEVWRETGPEKSEKSHRNNLDLNRVKINFQKM